MSRKSELARRVMKIAGNRRRSGGNRNQTLVQGAQPAMNYLQYETARELGLLDRIEDIGYENMTTKECGSIGGMMTKRMIAYAQQKMQEELDEKGDLSELPIFDNDFELWAYKPYTLLNDDDDEEDEEELQPKHYH